MRMLELNQLPRGYEPHMQPLHLPAKKRGRTNRSQIFLEDIPLGI